MIESFRHKGLRALYESDNKQKVPAAHAEKIGRILARLNEASKVQDMGLPGLKLHPLKRGTVQEPGLYGCLETGG